MNNKGITIIELVVSFSLTLIIALFLTEIVLFLKNVYIINGIKSEIIVKESLISDRLNTLIKDRKISSISSCGTKCINLVFSDNQVETINFNMSSNIINIGEFSVGLPTNVKINSADFSITNVDGVTSGKDNAIFRIDVELGSDLIEETFNINVLYQFDNRVIPLTIPT